jgi:hypothetical protein
MDTQKQIHSYLRRNLESLLSAKEKMTDSEVETCETPPYLGLTIRQMLRMEIAMYYTIQKLEVHMKGLEQNQLPKFVVNVQE